jgi:hypothetical protein
MPNSAVCLRRRDNVQTIGRLRLPYFYGSQQGGLEADEPHVAKGFGKNVAKCVDLLARHAQLAEARRPTAERSGGNG